MMRVADIQRYLKSVCDMLAVSGEKEAISELAHFRAELTPFGEMGLNEFIDVLHNARVEGGATAKRPPRSRSKLTVNMELVHQTLREVQDLYERAKTPDSLKHDFINDEVKRWDKALNKEEGFELGRAFLGADFSYPSKIAALEAVGRKIADRLNAHKRIGSLDRAYAAPCGENEAPPVIQSDTKPENNSSTLTQIAEV